MHCGNIVTTEVTSDSDSDATIVGRSRTPSPGPSVQIDFKVDANGDSIPHTVKFRNNKPPEESEFPSTIARPAFKTPEVPRPAVKVSDRFQLVEPDKVI
jgi:hypothetical protein